jgi:Pullulanase N2 domain
MQVHKRCRVDTDLFLWRQDAKPLNGEQHTFQLLSSPDAAIQIGPDGVTGATSTLQLEPCSSKDKDVQAAYHRFPHLRGCTPLRCSQRLPPERLDALVASQLCVAVLQGTALLRATGVQMPGVLDVRRVLKILLII